MPATTPTTRTPGQATTKAGPRTRTTKLSPADREAVEHARQVLRDVNETLYSSRDPVGLAWDLGAAAGALGVLLGIIDKIGGQR